MKKTIEWISKGGRLTARINNRAVVDVATREEAERITKNEGAVCVIVKEEEKTITRKGGNSVFIRDDARQPTGGRTARRVDVANKASRKKKV